MIMVTVRMQGDGVPVYEEIEITKDEILQLACNKAEGMYLKGTYNFIQADEGIELHLK